MRKIGMACAVLALLCVTAFTPTSGTAAPFTLVALGDSITGIVTFPKQGTPDSVVARYTGANLSTITHKPVGTADTALIVPLPSLSPGASITVTLTLTPYNGGNAGVPKVTTATYTKPAGVTIIGFNLTSP